MSGRQLEEEARAAIKFFWQTRTVQSTRQSQGDHADRGSRSAVTGGAQMDEFIEMLVRRIQEAGAPAESICRRRAVELPGFFRPSKKWDLLVIHEGKLLVALEAKSQIGPSFGNNFNDRTEEVMGSALDLWTAFREGAFKGSARPWLGYGMLLEDCPESQIALRVSEPHLKAFPEFQGASYAKRYELFCRRLIREGQYTAAYFLTSKATDAATGNYAEPASDLALNPFARSLIAHMGVQFG